MKDNHHSPTFVGGDFGGDGNTVHPMETTDMEPKTLAAAVETVVKKFEPLAHTGGAWGQPSSWAIQFIKELRDAINPA